MAYFKQAGHCTRCEAPFAADVTIYMVREDVIWAVVAGDASLSHTQTVAVCEQCLTVKERAQSMEAGACGGCGRRLMLATGPNYRDGTPWSVPACCDRCDRRVRRRQPRIKQPTCAVCNTKFETAPVNARFCSTACKRRADLLRRSDGRPSASK